MRVLITRPEHEATTLATALSQRGHVPVIAPLFHLKILHPPADFAASLAACQGVLLTSANGARALAEASEQRGRPILAVGDELVRQRLDPKAGPLVHVSGVDLALDLGEALSRHGFDVRRFALYDARAESVLPDSARAALQARALDAATFFSPRAASQFAKLVGESGLADSLRSVTAIGISPSALAPLGKLPFKATVSAARPTRQAVLDEIDRLAEAGVQGQAIMSDTPSSPPPLEPMPPPFQVRRGLGVFGAFVIGLVTAVIVLAGAVISLPFWPEQVQVLWRGQAVIPPAPTPALDLQSVQAAANAVANAAVETARRDLTARLDDLEKRLRALSATAAEKPTGSDPAVAELRSRVEALEGRPAAAPPTGTPAAPPAMPAGEADKEIAVLRAEITTLHTALQALDQSVTQKALVAARASAVIGVAARLSAALDSGLPFAADLNLLAPLAQGDAKLTEVAAALQPYAQAGVASRAALAASFPAVAKAALADDVADDSFGERLLGKVRSIVSLRRVGDDVPGDSAEAKLARAEAALDAGDLAKAVDLMKSLPPQTAKATQAWLARAEAHLAAKRAIDALAAHAVSLLGAVH